MTVTGQCLCGAMRYEFDTSPITARICWCRLCQKIGAGSATINVGFASASLRLYGERRDYVIVADSGNVIHQRFCYRSGFAAIRPTATTTPDAPGR